MSVELRVLSAGEISSLGCGGKFRRVAFPRNFEEARAVLSEFPGEDLRFIGGLTNTLVLSEGVDKLALSSKNLLGVSADGEIIRARSGEKTAAVVKFARRRLLSGMECLCGVPGTIGGAIMGNSGCFGQEICDCLERVTVLDSNGKIEVLERKNLNVGYRRSGLLRNGDFVLEAEFRLRPSTAAKIAEKTVIAMRKRKEKQPSGRSLGCVFKEIGGRSAGLVLEEAGLKGYGYGGMEFSARHANFIVNKGGTPEEYFYLVKLAERVVFEKFGLKPEREVQIEGESIDNGRGQSRTSRY